MVAITVAQPRGTKKNRMNEPVVNGHSVAVGAAVALQAALPAVIAVGSLFTVMVITDADFERHFSVMALVVALLSVLLIRVPRAIPGNILGGVSLAISVMVRWLVLLAMLLALAYVTKLSAVYSRKVVLIWAAVTPVLIVFATLQLHELMRKLLRDPAHARKAVIAGCTDSSLILARRLRIGNEFCLSVVGFFDDRSRDRLNVDPELPVLGRLEELPAFVRNQGAHVVFVALPVRHVDRVLKLIDELRDTTVSIYYLPDIFVFDLIQAKSGVIEGVPVIAMCETPFYAHRAVAKRITDVLLTTPFLIALAPLMLVIAITIRLSSGGPALFKQRRYGLHGEEIVIYKFRTMTAADDGPIIAQATRTDERFTRVGRFLRRYSLDELPQLINVLQGRMSLVGPRPHAVAHNEMYRKLIKGYMLRHKVLPGITGLAQVHGLRGETRTVEQMEARIRYDLEYLRSWSLGLDLEILARTAVLLLHDSRAF
jgi:putative colanic acid biosysnthesis UDP-glucose lipid carrier transferase